VEEIGEEWVKLEKIDNENLKGCAGTEISPVKVYEGQRIYQIRKRDPGHDREVERQRRAKVLAEQQVERR
jgi:hypothetical protein